MLIQAIGALLPAAVGVALSPVPIIAMVLMLGTPKARTNGPAFALGWVAGLVIVSIVVLVASSGASEPTSTTATTVNWSQVLFGALFLVLAMRQWRKRPRKGEEPEMPKWMATVDTFTAGRSLVLGAVLSGLNPKNLVLTAAAASTIAQAGLSAEQSAAAVAVFVVLASLTVVGPVVLYLAASDRAKAPLESIKGLMVDHNAVIMMVVLLVLGAKLIGEGLGAVAS